MNPEWKFFLKVVRNGVVLAGLYFVSVFATGTLTYETCKPVLIFLATYILSELATRYNLKPQTPKNRKGSATLIF